MEAENKIEIAVYRKDPTLGWNVNELDYGPLLASLTEDHWVFAITGEDGTSTYEEGSVQIQATRTHEWELIIGVVISGGAIFGKKVIEKVAEKFAEWAIDRAKRLGSNAQPEVQDSQGAKVVLDQSNTTQSTNLLANLLETAAAQNLRIQIVIEPKE